MPWDERDEGQGGGIEYVFSIASSKAGFTEYNEGKTALLILEGEKEFSNGRVMDDNLWVNTPDGWTVSDDGAFFVDKGGDEERRFGKRTKIQTFINSAIEAGVPLKERTENSLDARGWAGLKLRIREDEIGFTDRETKEKRTYQQPLVVEFLGEFDAGVAGTASAPVTAEAPTAPEGSNGDGPVARAKAIAKEASDQIDYMDKVSRELKVPLDHELCSAAFYEANKA